MDDPLVSVYISTHNRVGKLKRAVSSVINQTYKNIEIIICDDASTDETREYAQNLVSENKNIFYLRNDENKGACAARNLGIFSANGKFITGLDDDDEFETDRIACFINNWDDSFSFLCCDFVEKYQDGTSSQYYNKSSNESVSLNSLLLENIASNQVFTLTERLKSVNGFDIRARRLQDWDTWIRLASAYGDGVRLPRATYIMNHDHDKNEKRVSKSYPLSDALNDLYLRNINLYNDKNSFLMRFIISCLKGQSTFSSSLKSVFLSGNLKFLFKHFKYRYGSINE